MPELPDITVYREALEARIAGQTLNGVRLTSPFLLRTVEPPLNAIIGSPVTKVSTLGKRLVFEFPNDLFLVVHLMVAGRFGYMDQPGQKIPARIGLCAFDFPHATLLLREASKKKRASLHVVKGIAALKSFDRGGIDPLLCSKQEFQVALQRERRTLKRALTDPRIFSGIGNSYSDEILFAAKLSPLKRTDQLSDDEVKRLELAAKKTLLEWTDRLRVAAGGRFPTEVTAFHKEMAVHGRYGEPCPSCGFPVQRITYAENEANYCAHCQTEGRLLSDRSLARLMHDDWPKTIEELEEHRLSRGG